MIRIRDRRGARGVGPVDDPGREPAAGAARPARLDPAPDSDGEAVTPLGTAGTEDGPATAGLLADQEAVGSLAPAHGRLVGAFHGVYPGGIGAAGSPEPVFRKAFYST